MDASGESTSRSTEDRPLLELIDDGCTWYVLVRMQADATFPSW